ncbi:MAG: pyruvate kinase [Alphaproteobacteria bacterium]
MRRDRKAKIIATLGPASSSPESLEALFRAGADVFRFNFSHGSHDEHRERVRMVRALEEAYRRPIAVLIDLQGPKLRLGTFAEGSVRLAAQAAFRLDLSPAPGDEHRAPLPHPEIFSALTAGTDLLLDDGKVRLKVERVGADFAETRVITPGVLSNHKGVNVPDAVLSISALTPKDRADLEAGLDMGADWVALSFVQRPEDVAEARRLINGRAALLSKLEKPSAIEHLERIIELSDAVMVARGDLGVEVAPETVPILQKRIVQAGHRAGKPVVVATQMLDSMVNAPTPTRAEASDVATAVYDGADAVMLSAESAVGAYAVEAVTIMNRIIRTVEEDEGYLRIAEAQRSAPERSTADAISAAARQVAHTLSAAAIVTYTSSGSTTLRAARERPNVPILSLTANRQVARRLSLCWGAHCVLTSEISNFADMVKKACHIARREEFARSGDRLVITAGVPFGTPGTTNILRVAWLDEHGC